MTSYSYLTHNNNMCEAKVMCKKLPKPESIELTDEAVIENNRRMRPADKIAQVFALNRGIRQRMASVLEAQNPEWGVIQIQQEVARRMLLGAE